MTYNISSSTAPAMPKPAKGTECIKLLLTQLSKGNHEPFVPMFFPILGAHISGEEFQYPDNSWKEPTGMMANRVANCGDNKGQLTPLVEAICRDFRQHDRSRQARRASLHAIAAGVALARAPPAAPGCKDYSNYYLLMKQKQPDIIET